LLIPWGVNFVNRNNPPSVEVPLSERTVPPFDRRQVEHLVEQKVIRERPLS